MVLADWQVTIGEPTSVCVYLAPIYWSQTGEYLMIPIEARADKLMRIRVSQLTNMYGLGSGVSLACMDVLSYQRAYREVKSG
jgi:hypothetical protein